MNCRILAALATWGLTATLGFADDPKPADQVREQKDALAHAEQTARRITTSLRVMAYQKVDAGAEQKLLDEVAATLKGLSQDQIKAVLTHLEAAVKAPDEATATEEQRQAYQKHRQVVSSLRSMLVKLDALKSIDQAASRLTRMAQDERTMHEKSLRAENFRSLLRGPGSGFRRVVDDREEQADNQSDLRTDLTSLVQQLGILKPALNPEQKERLDKADAFGKSGRIMADMELAASSLSRGDFAEASEKQLRIAKDLQSLAAAIRTQRDALAEMKEARSKLDAVIREQEDLKKETAQTAKSPQQPEENRERFVRGNMNRQDPAKVQTHQLADKQDKLEFETRDIRKKLETLAPEAASKLNPAENDMKKAQDELRDQSDSKAAERAAEPQADAQDDLAKARAKLNELIEKAELQKSDPLAAVKKAAEMIDKLLKDQKQAKAMTEKETSPEKLKPAAELQKDVAKKTDEVKNLPLPESPDLRDALNKASDATKKASEELKNKDGPAALPKQEDAVKALEQAKKALEDKAKEIEKRRDDLAKLDEAAKKLDELKKQEDKVAKDAKASKDDAERNKDVAKEQEKIQPPTKDVGEMLKDIAPEATKKVAESAKSMEQAKQELQKNDSQKGNEQAKDASKKLEEAQEALAKKAEELKAKEIADQAALQPNQVNPEAAAQQLEKALEQAKEAAQQAQKAAQQSPEKNLAEMQDKLAKEAAKKNQGEASKDADQAAKSLEKGDLNAAMQKQQEALDKLNDAAKGEPKDGEKPAEGLAKQQKDLKDATEALAKSAKANQAAQAALNQAQALSPQAVQPQLGEAQKQLNDAQKQLGEGKPGEAGQSQQQAAQQLAKALGALQAAAQAMAQGQQPGEQQASGQQPGQKPGPGQQPGQKPGDQQAKGQPPGQQPGQKGDSQEKNEGTAEGNRTTPSKDKNVASSGKAGEGDGTFIQLQKKEREKVQQNAELAFPAEFRELIKQYNINIKNLLKPQTPKPEEKK